MITSPQASAQERIAALLAESSAKLQALEVQPRRNRDAIMRESIRHGALEDALQAFGDGCGGPR